MKLLAITLSASALLAAAAPPAAAQQAPPRAERPYRGLFGGGVGNAEQLLTFDLSVGAGYDDNIFAEQGIGSDPRNAKGGQFGSLSTGLSYSFNATDWTFSATGNANTRYSPGVAEAFTTGAGAALGISGTVWRGGRVTASGSAGYQPYFTLALVPTIIDAPLADAPVNLPEFAALQDDRLTYGAMVGVSQSVSRRGSLAFHADANRSEFRSGERGDTTTIGAGGGYAHNLAKGLGLRLGYGFRVARTKGSSIDTRLHSLDIGVDFSRAISFSRRTSLAFSTGSSAVTDGGDPQYHLTGAASLRHEIGRTWFAAAGYQRQVQFIDALADTYLSDGASVTLAGLVSRRLQFHSQASVGFAHPGGRSGSSEFDSYLGSVGIQYGVTRSLALGVDYAYYRYEFAPDAVLIHGFGRKLDRHSVRAHLSFWAPLLHRARRPDAAR